MIYSDFLYHTHTYIHGFMHGVIKYDRRRVLKSLIRVFALIPLIQRSLFIFELELTQQKPDYE